MTVNRLLTRLVPAMFRSSTIKTIIVAVGMTGSQSIHGALKGRLTTMSAAESIAAGSVIVSGGIPGRRAVRAKLCHHLRENRLVTAAGCLAWCLRPKRLLPRSAVTSPELRHRLFQCDPMTVGNSLPRRYWLDV